MTTCEEIEGLEKMESSIGSIGPEDKFCVMCGKYLNDCDHEDSCLECQ